MQFRCTVIVNSDDDYCQSSTMKPVKLNPSSSILRRIRYTVCRSTVLVLFLRNSSQLVTRSVLPERHPEQNKNDELLTTAENFDVKKDNS